MVRIDGVLTILFALLHLASYELLHIAYTCATKAIVQAYNRWAGKKS